MVYALTPAVSVDAESQKLGPLVAQVRRLPPDQRQDALAALPPEVRARVEAYLGRRTP